MRLTIHQPEHLPWLGFFAKMAAADAMVSLDSVPYRHHYFQNRNRLAVDGRPLWLTVPVRHRDHLQTAIRDIQIDENQRWRRSYLGRLRDSTRHAPHSADVVPQIVEIIGRPWTGISELNNELIQLIAELFGVQTPMRSSSDVEVIGSRSLLLAELCQAMGASSYLSGPSGRDYLGLEPFLEREVTVEFFDFAHPTYQQTHSESFVSKLAAVDAIAQLGIDGARKLFNEALARSQVVPAKEG